MRNTNRTFLLVLGGIIVLAVVFIVLLITSFSSRQETPSGKTTTVVIETVPKDATITIAEKRLTKKAPVTVKNIAVGTRLTIRAAAPQYDSVTRTVTITNTPRHIIRLNLAALTKQKQEGYDELDHNLVPTINPSYLQKIKEQPFWEMLPYFDPYRHFAIEYKDSDDTIIIYTYARGEADYFQTDTLQYRQEARDWLTKNGAQLNQLRITYNPAEL